MGKAKQRGTFEQRVEQAKWRNADLEKTIKPNSMADLTRQAVGIQRLATKLTAAGIISPVTLKQ